MGGKPDPTKKTSGTLPVGRMYQPEEELPFFAWFGDAPRITMSRIAAADLVSNARHLPEWARQIAPLDEANEVLRGA